MVMRLLTRITVLLTLICVYDTGIEGAATIIAIPFLLRETGSDSAVLKICSVSIIVDMFIAL